VCVAGFFNSFAVHTVETILAFSVALSLRWNWWIIHGAIVSADDAPTMLHGAQAHTGGTRHAAHSDTRHRLTAHTSHRTPRVAIDRESRDAQPRERWASWPWSLEVELDE
jgi:hypothetical protein